MKSLAKKLAVGCLAVVAAAAMAVGFAACGSSAADIEYMGAMAGGYVGSTPWGDMTAINGEILLLYDDGTYMLISGGYVYGFETIITEGETILYGTYEITAEDEYSVAGTLSGATRVIVRSGIRGEATLQDTDDESTFTGEEIMEYDESYNEVGSGNYDTSAYLLSQYSATSQFEIDLQYYDLTIS